MKSMLMVGALVVLAAVGAGAERSLSPVLAQAALERRLSLDYESDAAWAGHWRGHPADTVKFETAVVHAGRGAMVIERADGAPLEFSNTGTSLPVEFTGTKVELRGFLKVDQVVGRAGLWLRVDGEDGMLALDNMSGVPLSGTADWQEFAVRVPLGTGARSLVFGALLRGTGKLWVDDLRLLVDGRPVWEAPVAEKAETVLDRDHEFDGGSKIQLDALSPEQCDNLALLGRVWGFLKYHHPRVVAGELHWDYELFRVLPRVLAARDHAAGHAALAEWVAALGAVATPEAGAPLSGDLHLRPDLDWLDDRALLGAALSQSLRQIHAARSAKPQQFYVALAAGARNPLFERELAYPSLKLPDAGYQLLGLFRYWNIIEYWFPYRDLIGGDEWRAAVREFVPRVALAANADACKLEMLQLIERVGDSHADLRGWFASRPPTGGFRVPAAVRFVDREAVVTHVASAAEREAVNLSVGDVIEAIDGVRVEELVRQLSPYYPASNEPTKLRNIARVLLRCAQPAIRLQVRRGDERLTVDVQGVPIGGDGPAFPATRDLPGEAFRLLSPDVAYLKLSAVSQVKLEECLARAAGTKGLIVDIRNYPSAFVVFTLGGLLVTQPTEFARFTRADLANPGAFRFDAPVKLSPASRHYGGRVMILVDEVSQSNAEYTAMALRVAPGAKVIGSTTAGADGNVSEILLPGGLRTAISGIGVFYPDKRPTQRIGIVPDIEVKPTVAGIRAGRDEVLEAALREILGAEVSEEAIRALVPTK